MPLDDLTFFLENHEAEVVEEFRKQIVVAEHDQYRGMIHLNGQAMYRLVVGYLGDRISQEDISIWLTRWRMSETKQKLTLVTLYSTFAWEGS